MPTSQMVHGRMGAGGIFAELEANVSRSTLIIKLSDVRDE